MADEIYKSGFIPLYNNKFVLIKSTNKGKYVFPKGGIKKNETALQAALRETHEEAGDIIDKTNIKEFGPCEGVFWYIGEVVSICESEEKRGVLIAGFDEVLSRTDVMGTKTIMIVKEYCKRNKK